VKQTITLYALALRKGIRQQYHNLGVGTRWPRRVDTMTDRQRAFLDGYFADPWRRGRTTRAAAAAGYAWPDKQGSRLKSFPEIAAAIRAESERWEREWLEREWAEVEEEMDRDDYEESLPRPKGTRSRYQFAVGAAERAAPPPAAGTESLGSMDVAGAG
jgi:phage terminase small subunit